MISSLLTKLHSTKKWVIDDEPHLWEGIVDKDLLPLFATWDDIEHCLNNPQFYSITFINREVIQFLDIKQYERCWSSPCAEVSDLMMAWEAGHNLIINNFDQGFPKKQALIGEFEKYFDGKTSFHIYAGLKTCNSFRVHEDTANNFIMQIEGETHWKVYKNRCSNIVKKQPQLKEEFDFDATTLDAYSTMDIDSNEQAENVAGMEVVIDHVLKPGDMLYIPARCYHQAQPDGKRLSVSIPMQHMLPHLKPIDRKWYDLPH